MAPSPKADLYADAWHPTKDQRLPVELVQLSLGPSLSLTGWSCLAACDQVLELVSEVAVLVQLSSSSFYLTHDL